MCILYVHAFVVANGGFSLALADGIDDFITKEIEPLMPDNPNKKMATPENGELGSGVNINGPKSEANIKNVKGDSPSSSPKGNGIFEEVFEVVDNYKLSDNTFNNHILDRHGPNSIYRNKSHFDNDFDIKKGIDETLKSDKSIVKPNTSGRNGYIFEQTFTSPIGKDAKGKPINTLKVVIDAKGNVITAFPTK